ncbi:host attachment family protein [Robiginitomaculum antarcticum]|uniref:host attachment family protein n=1 Tax=Robiginitomaculum antarcticum TaxID=437507 RepID=UPI00037C0DB9|nr:host attachment family protein [Robiginitomaculum antarcticum]
MTDLNIPEETLLVIATGEEAKLFRIKGGKLKNDGHWTPQNLADEGPSGKSPPDQSDRESMEATFSKQVAERLYALAHKGKFHRLILCADPDSLGEIRPLLHKEVEDKIILELDKTLINSPMDDIERTLSKHF